MPAEPADPAALTPGVVELLGVLCYGELVAFERIAADAALAPGLSDRYALSAMAVDEHTHHHRLREHLKALGQDPDVAMAPFVAALDDFHNKTRPNDWLEGVIKIIVGDGIARDFYREVAATVPDRASRELLLEVLAEGDHLSWATARVRRAIAEQPVVGGRLALWGRRLVGEALASAQRVAVDHDELTALLVGGVGDLAALGQLLVRLTDAHEQRMAALGLAS